MSMSMSKEMKISSRIVCLLPLLSGCADAIRRC